ncbi:MAG: 23S rRNA (uracil(1939)-C(5))-methyltransferase RlmD [Chitinispirillaceae bacterium]|nr:23S rRNA (uracil(1939)-C(5))-methyltransferase RlmD [Chitinispirillaceae bacterium]
MISCPHFPRCGGCSTLTTPYREQLNAKHALLRELFHPFTDTVPPVIGSPQSEYYRHKVQLPFGTAGRGSSMKPTVGCYSTDSHHVVDQHACRIQDRDLSTIAWTLRDWAVKTGLPVYNERTGNGFLRHVVLRKGAGTGEVLIGLVTSGGRIEGSRSVARLLLSMLGKKRLNDSTVVGIVQNVNTRRTNVVLGNEEYLWWGRPYLKELMGEWKYKIGISTFFQVNPFQTPNLYNEVLRYIEPGSRVIDCFCGVGSIALWISRKAAQVKGIEENPESIRAARTAAKLNGAENVQFITGDAEAQLCRTVREGYSCVVVDPPRKGLTEGSLAAINDSGINRVVYVSCNPQTLRRDVEQLQSASFYLRSVQGVDMFPHTVHIEAVALLDRQ